MEREHNLTISNTHLRQTLQAINLVLGEKSSKEVYRSADLAADFATLPPDNLNEIFKAEDYSRLFQAVELEYGQDGPSILERVGREIFHIALREQPTFMASAKRVMRLIPQEQRIQIMLQTILDTQRKIYPHSQIWLEEKHDQLAYIEQNCRICAGRQNSQPVCYLMVGFISEAVRWSTGKDIRVDETDCIAKGDAFCRFSIGI